ncbi:MAG TPA: sensor histidine kinase [Ktedonobacteraceae bacterium]|nr:sensor histidine kinase [Ktedonobacteraceae bacterium]
MSKQTGVMQSYRERLLSQASQEAAAEERNRLARDLHDSIKQQLFSIRMSTLVAQAQLTKDTTKVQEALADIQQSAMEAQVEMQALLQQLRPLALERASFAEAVRTQAQALEYRSGARVYLALADLPAPDRCPLSMQEAVFRIVQEAFANIARHARASEVNCTVTCDDETLRVTIRDDGQGFETQSTLSGMGLLGMQERAGALDGLVRVESQPGQGTTVHVSIPLFLPAEIKQQQEQREQEARELAARAHTGLYLRSTMAIFTLLVLLIDIAQFTTNVPASAKEVVLLILGFCLFLMYYGLFSTRLALTRLRTKRAPGDRETGSLLLQEHQGWSASLRLTLFGSWHLVLWGWHWFPPQTYGWLEGGLALGAFLVLVLLLFEQWCIKRTQDRYYPLLSEMALRRVLRQRWRTARLRLILIICVVLSFVVNGALFTFPAVPLWQWLMYSFFFALCMQCLCLALDVWQLQPWRALARAAGSVRPTQPERGEI